MDLAVFVLEQLLYYLVAVELDLHRYYLLLSRQDVVKNGCFQFNILRKLYTSP